MKCVNSDNGGREKSEENMKISSSLEKRVHQRKGIVHPHPARKEEEKNPSRRDKIWRKHQTVRKKRRPSS